MSKREREREREKERWKIRPFTFHNLKDVLEFEWDRDSEILLFTKVINSKLFFC